MIELNIPQFLVKAVDDKLPRVFNTKTVFRDKTHAIMGITTEIAVISKLTGDIVDIKDDIDNGYDLILDDIKWDIKTTNIKGYPSEYNTVYVNDYSYQQNKADGYIFCFTNMALNKVWILGALMRDEIKDKFDFKKKGEFVKLGSKRLEVYSDKWMGNKDVLNEIK